MAIDTFIRIIFAKLKSAGNDYERAETGYSDDLSICNTRITRNEGKCVFLDAGKIGCPEGVIKRKKVRYLGAEMNMDGSLDWKDLLERTGRRLSKMKPLVSMYKIRAQVEFLNIFVVSMWTYLLRVYKVKDETLARFRRLISSFFKGRSSAIRLEGDWIWTEKCSRIWVLLKGMMQDQVLSQEWLTCFPEIYKNVDRKEEDLAGDERQKTL